MKNKMAIRARASPVNGSQIFAWQYGVSCPPQSGHDADAFYFLVLTRNRTMDPHDLGIPGHNALS